MLNNRIEILIVKYCTNELDENEANALIVWLELDDNKVIFNKYIDLNYAVEKSSERDSLKKSESWRYIESKKKRIYPIWKYAAAVLLIIGSSYFFRDIIFNNPVENVPTIVNTKIEPGTDKATLTLEDGSQIVLEKGKSFQTGNANSNGEEIVYNTQKQKTTEVIFNYLTIPRGGQWHVKLSDGTEVWLNSESQLKYPVRFRENETRKVELVYGEAYFDVSPSTENNGLDFKVYNNKQEVHVIGSEFNIKAYKDETHIYTTLVVGKVDVSIENRKQSLIPNQQLNFDLVNNNISIAKVDVKTEISWKNGVFSFKNKPLKDIMRVISRWYDVDIIFLNKDLESLKFKGVIDKQQNIEEILLIMKSSTINNYTIKNKSIILE